jgi:hypothetical protein
MRILRAFGLLALSTAACGDEVNIKDFDYGGGQPGQKLAEGGEIRHENVRILGLPEQTWLMVYQYTAAASVPTAPFAAPDNGGKGQFGNCVDERNTAPTWPFHPITGATYLTLPQVKISGPGFAAPTDVPLTNNAMFRVGNSTFRSYGVTYGGGAPGDPPSGFNGMLNAGQSKPDSDYTIDIGKKGPDAAKGNAMTYHMPAAYTAPLGIGGKDPVIIAAGKDLEYSWTAPANDKGTDGNTHTAKTYFNFTFFADPTNAGHEPQFICFPDRDGHQVVPKAVIDALPAKGLIVNADLSHQMEAREANTGEMRRFDLVTIFCNISAYEKQ